MTSYKVKAEAKTDSPIESRPSIKFAPTGAQKRPQPPPQQQQPQQNGPRPTSLPSEQSIDAMVVITIAPKSDPDNGNAENGCNGDESVGSGMIVTNGDSKSSASVVTTSDRDTVTVTAGIQGGSILLT